MGTGESQFSSGYEEKIGKHTWLIFLHSMSFSSSKYDWSLLTLIGFASLAVFCVIEFLSVLVIFLVCYFCQGISS